MKDPVKFYAGVLAAIAAVLALLGASAWCYHAGRLSERAVWQAKEAGAAQEQARQLAAEFQRGQAASNALHAELSTQETHYANLERASREVRRRVPLVLPDSVHPVCHLPSADAVSVAPDAAPSHAASGSESAAVDGGGSRLSRGAVWMWNSALAGADAPAGACGLADTSGEACALDSGLTLDDAWDNHAINAKSCATDRLRHRALIEFLTETTPQ